MKDYNYKFQAGDPQNDYNAPVHEEKRSVPQCSLQAMLVIVTLVAAIAVIFTYTLTANAHRRYYVEQIKAQQALIQALQENGGRGDGFTDSNLTVIAKLLERFSYYAGSVSEEELIDAVLLAYADAIGDHYAEYYTKEEYEAMMTESVGEHYGIGVSVAQTPVTVNGIEYQAFQVLAIYKNAPAETSGLAVGDFIYSIRQNGEYKTVEALGGYSKALALIKGEKGTRAEIAAFRAEGDGFRSIEFGIIRDSFESVSVSYALSESDPTVGIVRISQFDLTTPNQLKDAVYALKKKNVRKFVFDVRNNPGGDLQSIKAVLSYFLQKGDLILKAIDKDGNVARAYYAEPILHKDEYASCNVLESEIGIFSDLEMTVICNGNTASAAEVFTATLRDYGLATVVGETTFGKGIMQSFLPLSLLGDYSGYIKMTTYAYVTKSGETYHEIGIKPHTEVVLSDEAKQYHFYLLPQDKDNQLIAAIQQFQ
jgi:carboxyl-terminal processing protease